MKRKTLNTVLVLSTILLLFSGCTASEASVIYKYRTTGDDIIENFYLEKTEIYPDKVIIYWDGTIDNLDEYNFSEAFEIKRNKLVLTTDKPRRV